MKKLSDSIIKFLIFVGMWSLIAALMYHLPLSIEKSKLDFSFWILFFWILGLIFVILAVLINYGRDVRKFKKDVLKSMWAYIDEFVKFVASVLMGIVIYGLISGILNQEFTIWYILLVFITGFLLFFLSERKKS